ncbi:MAG: glycerophosphodiester phosphodiesterase family protein [Alphaproteobacteria bacterium]|nr:glycerophosphodiester phosphodiesterase family protein [Alphaproteobacteria bacterium]
MITLPKLIGHRGAAARAPENTLASFEAAADLGLTWIELDLYLTADSNLAVIHDRNLSRTTNGTGDVTKKKTSDLSSLDAGNGQPIPIFKEIIDLCIKRNLGLNIELKDNIGMERETVRVLRNLLEAYWPKNLPLPLISSFNTTMLKAAKSLLPHLPRGLLLEDIPPNWATTAQKLSCKSIHVNHHKIDESKIRLIREAGYLALAYTVNDPGIAEKLWHWGIDSLFTDLPPAMDRII